METADIDLALLAAALERRRLHKDLCKRIKRCLSVASANQDLQNAQDAMSVLAAGKSEQQPSEMTRDNSMVVGSLFAHAIILYTRATETEPIDRWRWFGRDMLTTGEREWHAQIMGYRNKVLVHFGHGKHLKEGASIRHALVVRIPREHTGSMDVAYFETRAQTRSAISAKLRLLIDKTVQLSRTAFDDRLIDLQQPLLTALRDREVSGLARDCVFDHGSIGEWPTSDLFEMKEGAARYFAVKGKHVIEGSA